MLFSFRLNGVNFNRLTGVTIVTLKSHPQLIREKARDEALFCPPMGDFLDAGGLIYPGVGAFASSVDLFYLNVPQGKTIPIRVEPMP